MKIGLKSSLLPGFFPISCSGEFQPCCAGEAGHVGESPQELQRSGGGVSFLTLAPWRVVSFSENGGLCDLGGSCILL